MLDYVRLRAKMQAIKALSAAKHLDTIEKFGLHLRLLFDCSDSIAWNENDQFIYPEYHQTFMKIADRKTFKLCSVPSTNSDSRQLYTLQSIDGNNLCVNTGGFRTVGSYPFEFLL